MKSNETRSRNEITIEQIQTFMERYNFELKETSEDSVIYETLIDTVPFEITIAISEEHLKLIVLDQTDEIFQQINPLKKNFLNSKDVIESIQNILDSIFIKWIPNEDLFLKPKLNDFAKKVHENAVEHGWWEVPKSFGEICALLHSEISEAFEEYRNSDKLKKKDLDPVFYILKGKPEGIGIELADEILRILDYCAAENIDIERLLRLKNLFNLERPYKHGGKKL